MANSVKPGPAGHHHHHRHHRHTAGVPPKAAIPARTPGTTGRLDHGDPTITTLLGWTPNVTGLRDWADHTLHDLEVWAERALGSIGRDPHTGAPTAAGSAPVTAKAAAGQMTLDDAQLMALKISTVFEGGVSMNYKALADNFDGQGTSFGLVQWNFGQNTLGPLLKKMLAANPTAFAACFPADADYATLKSALDANSQPDQMAWARAVLATKTKKAAWRAAFHAIGAVDAFQKVERDGALAEYHPLVVKCIAVLRKISPSLMTTIEVRTYCALYDLCVQEHGLTNAVDAIKDRVKNDKPQTQLDLLKIAVTERGKKAKHLYASDAISRRMGILTGGAYESTEFGHTAKRVNDQYKLVTENGTKTIPGL